MWLRKEIQKVPRHRRLSASPLAHICLRHCDWLLLLTQTHNTVISTEAARPHREQRSGEIRFSNSSSAFAPLSIPSAFKNSRPTSPDHPAIASPSSPGSSPLPHPRCSMPPAHPSENSSPC